jgi:hypothetical protein
MVCALAAVPGGVLWLHRRPKGCCAKESNASEADMLFSKSWHLPFFIR